MKKRDAPKVVFKSYDQQQGMLLPPSLDELIAVNHPVRVVNKVLDKIDIQPLINQYKPGGTSSFHPRMLLKVMVFAYINNIYSSRKIEAALQESIYFMWLSARSTPDHHTINRFRGERLKEPLQKIFTEVVELLIAEGLLNIKELYTDGTKIEANANRYTFVWGKAIKTSKERIKKQLSELWQYAQHLAFEEMDDTDPSGFDKIDAEKVEKTIDKINEALKDKPVSKEVKQKLGYAKKNWPANLKKYEDQDKIIGEQRSSYSKIDHDATFMRMKEDHMKNGQLKPAYNVQISTNNQFIASYSVHQNTTDTNTLSSHLASHENHYKQSPEVMVADAGYGSEENYKALQDKGIEAYIKHNQFDRQQNKNIQNKKPFTPEKLYYNKEQDCYYCPMGQAMKNIGTAIKTTSTGFKQTLTKYQAKNCEGCPLRGACHKAHSNRIIEVNHNLNHLKQKADERLLSEEGIRHRKQRPCDVEPVFGNIKSNHQFKRFMLRGIKKVTTETGLLALAHNLRKKYTLNMKKAA
jgi:transposase